MEIQTMLLSLLAFVTLVSFSIYSKKKRGDQVNLPPRSLGWPLIGETLHFYKAQRSNRVFEDFFGSRTKKYGEVFKTGLMGSKTVVFTGLTGNRFVLSNEFKTVVSSWPRSSVRLVGEKSIMEKQGVEHHRLRAAVTGCLRGEELKKMVPMMSEMVEKLFKEASRSCEFQHGIIKLFPLAKHLTFLCICRALLGFEEDEESVVEDFLGMFEKVLKGVLSVPLELPWSRYRKAMVARHEIDGLLRKVIAKRRKMVLEKGLEWGQDLLSRLLAMGLDDGEVGDNCVLFVFAAYETTSLVMCLMCKDLSLHPHCYEKLVQEHKEVMRNKKTKELNWEDVKSMVYTWQVAQETMRLTPPIFGSFRRTLEDINFEGYIIPKGWKILWTTATHYNNFFFPNSNKYHPSRFDNNISPTTFLAFGGGARFCAGYELAKLQIKICMHQLVTEYDWKVVNPSEKIVMDPLPSPMDGMPIKLIPKSKPMV